MNNLNRQSWDELWNSPEAEKVRKKVRCCDRDCWMIGSVSPSMHKYIGRVIPWVAAHKLKSMVGLKYSMYELPICCEYRDGKVTKEDLEARKYNLAFVVASSYMGDLFEGAVGSTLYIDNVRIICTRDE